MSTETPERLHREAAEIAAAVLRFHEPLAHLSSSGTPEGRPVVGVDACVFLPSSAPIRKDRVPDYLAGLPCPAFLVPTTLRGFISLILLDDLTGERRAAMQHELDNQTTGLTESAPGADSDRVLLEFDDEANVFSLGSVRRWAGQYPIFVGWNVAPCADPSRAEWQLNLFGGDGRRYSRGVGPPART